MHATSNMTSEMDFSDSIFPIPKYEGNDDHKKKPSQKWRATLGNAPTARRNVKQLKRKPSANTIPDPHYFRRIRMIESDRREEFDDKTSRLNTYTFALGFAGFIISQIDTEIYAQNDFQNNTLTNLLRLVVSLLTILCEICLLRFYNVQFQIKVHREILHPASRLWDDSVNFTIYLVEAIFIAIHMPPFIQWRFNLAQLDQVVTYDLALTLSSFTAIRIYLFLRLVPYALDVFSPRFINVCGMCSVKPSVSLAIRIASKQYPLMAQSVMLSSATVIFGIAARNAERLNVYDFKHIWNGFYICIITMFTIGYGDLIPSTHFGRAILLCVAFVGYSVISVFVVSLTNLIELNSEENRAFEEVKSIYERRRVLEADSRRLIQLWTRLWILRRRGSQNLKERLILAWKAKLLEKRLRITRYVLATSFQKDYIRRVLEDLDCYMEEDVGRLKMSMVDHVDNLLLQFESLKNATDKVGSLAFKMKMNTLKIHTVIHIGDLPPNPQFDSLLFQHHRMHLFPVLVHKLKSSAYYRKLVHDTFPQLIRILDSEDGLEMQQTRMVDPRSENEEKKNHDLFNQIRKNILGRDRSKAKGSRATVEFRRTRVRAKPRLSSARKDKHDSIRGSRPKSTVKVLGMLDMFTSPGGRNKWDVTHSGDFGSFKHKGVSGRRTALPQSSADPSRAGSATLTRAATLSGTDKVTTRNVTSETPEEPRREKKPKKKVDVYAMLKAESKYSVVNLPSILNILRNTTANSSEKLNTTPQVSMPTEEEGVRTKEKEAVSLFLKDYGRQKSTMEKSESRESCQEDDRSERVSLLRPKNKKISFGDSLTERPSPAISVSDNNYYGLKSAMSPIRKRTKKRSVVTFRNHPNLVPRGDEEDNK